MLSRAHLSELDQRHGEIAGALTALFQESETPLLQF